MKQKDNSYNVAFRYTRKTGGSHGVVTWTSFSSREEFQEWYTPEMQEIQEVVGEGITQERAVELTLQTPLFCRVAGSIETATMPDGSINQDLLAVQIANAAYAEAEAKKRGY